MRLLKHELDLYLKGRANTDDEDPLVSRWSWASPLGTRYRRSARELLARQPRDVPSRQQILAARRSIESRQQMHERRLS